MESNGREILTNTNGNFNETDWPSLEKQKLTPDYAARLIFWSYKLSQGNTGLQKEIFEYLHDVHPEWQVTNEMKQPIFEKTFEIANKYLNESSVSPHRLDAEKITEDLKGQIELLVQFLEKNLKYERPKEHVLKGLKKSFIDSDFYFLEKERKSSPKKYKSYICDYILGHYKTSIPEYDKMLGELRPLILEDLKDTVTDSRFDNQLERIIKAYNIANPKALVDLKKLTKESK